MNITTLAIAAFGMLLILAAAGCTSAHVENPEDAKLFGKIHWGLIGFVGYALIVATSSYFFITCVLVGITTVITAWLIRKAIKIRLGCPICPMVWVLNLALLVVTILRAGNWAEIP